MSRLIRPPETANTTCYAAVRKQYRRILTQGAKELPDLPARKGQRGKPPKTGTYTSTKRSGTFHSVKMAQACCRVTSYLQTMNMPGYNPLTAIERARKGKAVGILKEKL